MVPFFALRVCASASHSLGEVSFVDYSFWSASVGVQKTQDERQETKGHLSSELLCPIAFYTAGSLERGSLDPSAWRAQPRHLARAHVLHFVPALLHAPLLLPAYEALISKIVEVLVPILGQETDEKANHEKQHAGQFHAKERYLVKCNIDHWASARVGEGKKDE